MAKSSSAHLQVAVEAIAKAQAAANKELAAQGKKIEAQSKRIDKQEKKIETQSKINQSQGQDIAKLEKAVQELRDTAIKLDLGAGMKGKDAAKKYGLTEGRISQIKTN